MGNASEVARTIEAALTRELHAYREAEYEANKSDYAEVLRKLGSPGPSRPVERRGAV